MNIPQESERNRIWRCLHCRSPLAEGALELHCTHCGKAYPVIGDVPILVREPRAYLRSELSHLIRAARDARQRRELLDGNQADAGLTAVSLERHRDVMNAEIAQIDTLLTLLEPVAHMLRKVGAGDDESMTVRRSGWQFDSLIPYLLRDWTNNAELRAASQAIGTALRNILPEPSDKTIVLAGCGAGGLLPEISAGFRRVLGFDLALAIIAAARHLLDGRTLDLALPRTIRATGNVSLRRRDGSSESHIDILAMDAFDMAFADDSIDCVITSFFLDLIPDPRSLAREIHRVLCRNGIWINYGPSGPLKALWRFDQAECAAFLESAGFTVMQTEAHRSTYLDISHDCPSWSFRNHMCYLVSAKKTRPPAAGAKRAAPSSAEIPDAIPQLFPGANLIQRRSLGPEQRQTIVLRHERTPGRPESREIGAEAVQMLLLVDGKRSVRDIATLLEQSSTPISREETILAFERFFNEGLLAKRHAP